MSVRPTGRQQADHGFPPRARLKPNDVLDFDHVKELESAVAVALGEQENGTARLEAAVVAFRAALEEYTRDRAPLQ